MAHLIKGIWSIELLESRQGGNRPNPSLLFSITEEQALTIHPNCVQALLFMCAQEVAKGLALNYPNHSIHVFVDNCVALVNQRVHGIVRIAWPTEVVPPEEDKQYVKAAMSVLPLQLQHLEQTQKHHTIVSVASQQEADQLYRDPEFELVVSVRTNKAVLIRLEPEITINAPSTKGVN